MTTNAAVNGTLLDVTAFEVLYTKVLLLAKIVRLYAHAQTDKSFDTEHDGSKIDKANIASTRPIDRRRQNGHDTALVRPKPLILILLILWPAQTGSSWLS